MIQLTNDGPALTSTNYWHSPLAEAGKMYLSLNARCFRLLLPPMMQAAIPEMATGKFVRVFRAPPPHALRLMFDDGTDNPYQVHLSVQQIDVLPAPGDEGRSDLQCVVYDNERRGKPHAALQRQAVYVG
jgi:hypothetical protein